jgi:hypothetical protein
LEVDVVEEGEIELLMGNVETGLVIVLVAVIVDDVAELVVLELVADIVEDVAELVGSDCCKLEDVIETSEAEVLKGTIRVVV